MPLIEHATMLITASTVGWRPNCFRDLRQPRIVAWTTIYDCQGIVMQKYAALHTISLVLRGIGWLLIVLAIIFFLIGIASLSQNNGPVDSGLGALKIISAISFLGMGVLTLAFGELIQVFVDIADNTRAAVVLLKNPGADLGDILDHGPEQKHAQAYRYDKDKWNALVEFDLELARVEAVLRPYGQKYIDQLATAYLTLNDKNKLSDIIKKIVETARQDAAEAKAAEERLEKRFSDPAFVDGFAREKIELIATRPYGNVAVLLLKRNGQVSSYSDAATLRRAMNDEEHWSGITNNESKIRVVRSVAAHIST